MSSNENLMSQNQPLVTKLNSTLISIVKLEFQSDWKNFISELCSDANSSQSKCENALNILKLLSEEVFDFSKNSITANEAKQLKDQMTAQFEAVFNLCNMVVKTSIS